MAKGIERAVYYRAVRFPVKVTQEQLSLLITISENLRVVWNEALKDRISAYEAWKQAKESGTEKLVKIPTLYDQINLLTNRRDGDADFASVPRNWQEETLDRLNGSFASFFALIKRGDRDARTPRPREEGFFQVIPGRHGFSIQDGQIVFSRNKYGETLAFPIPPYAVEKLKDRKTKKFVLSRSEHNLAKEGRYFISVVYEVNMPEVVSVVESNRVFVAIGASSIGVLADNHEEVIDLWRPDKYWKPKIEAVETRLKNPELKKGSKKSLRLVQARRRMFELISRQQRQNHREVVAKLCTLGRHFVVTDYTVRSKKGKLADGNVPERGGSQGLNWAAQNTGSFLDLVMHLEGKVEEFGGSVTRVKVGQPPHGIGKGHENKIAMARHLQSVFTALG